MTTSSTNALEGYLVHAPQREEAGSLASDRFDYQKNWALVRLLRLHRQEGDYVLLCELHEDVTVIDSSSMPTSAVFYQVKTDNNKLWTIKRLIRRKKSAKGNASDDLPSILGKLCAKATSLNGQTVTYQFVTNSGFSFKAADGKSASLNEPAEHLASNLLHPNEWNELTNALREELGIDLSDSLKDTLSFAVAELPLQMHNTAALGVVSEFLEGYAPGCGIVPNTFYRTLFDELKRRTSAPKPNGDLPAICRAKGIDRAKFNIMMKGALKIAPSTTAWPMIMQELQRDGVSLQTRIDLNEASKSYYIRSLSTTDSGFRQDRRLLVSESEKALAQTPNVLIFDLASKAYAEAQKNEAYGTSGLTDLEALVLIMVELYERQHDQIPDADAQPEEKDA